MKGSKAIKPVIEYASQNGWEVKRRTLHNTVVYQKPGRKDISIALYPKDHRAVDNALARFKREDCLEKEQHNG